MRFPEELPISAHVLEIARAVDEHQAVIVAGETGSGKSTQLPKICLAMGRGVHARIGVTQPRRIAATSLATRIASELKVEVGREVGYQIRFNDRTGPLTYVKLMTDGILLAEMQGDPMLRAYDTIIVDEAHERSLNIDFLLGYLQRLLPKRPDLRVIVSSATLETERFSAFFGGAPVIQVSGRTFPVDVMHRPPGEDEGDVSVLVANAVEEVTDLDPRGDILVFLPGEREIREAMDELTQRALPHTVLLPLHGRLPQADQQRVFQTLPQRRIILATNVAETSLTIPGIVYVVDAGYARLNRYDTRTGVTRLKVETISRASADQRKGRAGRIEAGVCVRLCSKEEDDARDAYTDPEILRVGLAGVILRMLALGLGRIDQFPLLDPPPRRSVEEGYRVLEELGALDENGTLTEIGIKLADLPLDPRIGRMILAGEREGALREVLILAAALGIQDPRDRPLAAQQKADAAHRRFADEASDFAGLLKIWGFYEQQKKMTTAMLRRACRENFLSWIRMREWEDVHRDLTRIAREMGHRPSETPASGEAIHRSLLPGLLSRIGVWQAEPRSYLGARQVRFALHPSSGLTKRPPAWVMAAELVETTKLYARNAARIEPAWIEELAGPLARRRHTDPHWSERSAQVMAKEQVTVYGLPVVRDRSVHFGPIDPRSARRVFIVHALVRREYTTKAPFFAHNEKVFEEARRLKGKARKSDMLADEDLLGLFFEARIPDGVYSGKTFEAFRKEAEAKDPEHLFLTLDDVLGGEREELSEDRYPDELMVNGIKLPLSYKFEPSDPDDGITIRVPLALLPQLDPGKMEWTIPGWQREKLLSLLESLPKPLRKAIGPAPDVLSAIESSLRPFEEPLRPALSRVIFDLLGVRIPQDAYRPDELPHWFTFHFRIEDESGHVLAEGRDLPDLCDRLGPARARILGRRPPHGGRAERSHGLDVRRPPREGACPDWHSPRPRLSRPRRRDDLGVHPRPPLRASGPGRDDRRPPPPLPAANGRLARQAGAESPHPGRRGPPRRARRNDPVDPQAPDRPPGPRRDVRPRRQHASPPHARSVPRSPRGGQGAPPPQPQRVWPPRAGDRHRAWQGRRHPPRHDGQARRPRDGARGHPSPAREPRLPRLSPPLAEVPPRERPPLPPRHPDAPHPPPERPAEGPVEDGSGGPLLPRLPRKTSLPPGARRP